MKAENSAYDTDSLIVKEDVYSIEGSKYVYRKRYYRELTKEELQIVNEKNICRIDKKNCLLVKIWVMHTEERIEILQKYLNKFNLQKWEQYSCKKIKKANDYNSVCDVENKLDWLSTFFIAGREGDNIVSLTNNFTKKENTITTDIVENANKNIKFSIVQLNDSNYFILDESIYFQWVFDNAKKTKACNRTIHKNKEIKYKLKLLSNVKLSPKQKQIVKELEKNSRIYEACRKLGLSRHNVHVQIGRVKKKIKDMEEKNMKNKPQYCKDFRNVCIKVIDHMSKCKGNYTENLRYYCKKIDKIGHNWKKFYEICVCDMDNIDRRKVYGAVKYKYKIRVDLFCKIINNLKNYVDIQKAYELNSLKSKCDSPKNKYYVANTCKSQWTFSGKSVY